MTSRPTNYDLRPTPNCNMLVAINPKPFKSSASFGEWAVLFYARRPANYGPGYVRLVERFWRKRDALEWVSRQIPSMSVEDAEAENHAAAVKSEIRCAAIRADKTQTQEPTA